MTTLASYAPELPATRHACRVHSITALTDTMFDVQLAPSQPARFYSGQYLMLDTGAEGVSPQPYSIASAIEEAGDDSHIHLHIANSSDTAQNVLSALKHAHEQQSDVHAQLPMGDCFITPAWLDAHPNQPIVLVGAGSGYSQLRSFIISILAHDPKRSVDLYWSNRAPHEFYQLDQLNRWQTDFANVRCHQILETATPDWTHRSGMLFEVLQEDFKTFNEHHLFICGSPQMVYGTISHLTPLGLRDEHAYSDVFAYAPR